MCFLYVCIHVFNEMNVFTRFRIYLVLSNVFIFITSYLQISYILLVRRYIIFITCLSYINNKTFYKNKNIVAQIKRLYWCLVLVSSHLVLPSQQFIFVYSSGHNVFANISHSVHVTLLSPERTTGALIWHHMWRVWPCQLACACLFKMAAVPASTFYGQMKGKHDIIAANSHAFAMWHAVLPVFI